MAFVCLLPQFSVLCELQKLLSELKMAQVFPKKYTQPKQVMQQADKHNYSTKQLLYDGASPHLQMSLFIFWTKMKHIAAAVAW